MPFFKALVCCFLCLICRISFAQTIIDASSRFHPAQSSYGMVVSQDAIASDVGASILARGGNAVDAAVATGFALAVTFPQAGNLGGGGFMLIHLAESDQQIAIDYREMAPQLAHRDMFLDENGNVDNKKSRFSIASTGIPGTVAGLLHAHEKYGKLPLEEVMEPAITLARDGFTVPPSLAYSLNRASGRLENNSAANRYFLQNKGQAPTEYTSWKQEDLASTLERILDKGFDGFYKGLTAALIVEESDKLDGLISLSDLANYRVIERPAVRGSYRGFDIVSMPPPSSGGVHLVQMLNILENFDLKPLEHNSADYLHLLVESMRYAFADRSLHLGDPDFHNNPIERLTDKAYAQEIANKFSNQATPSAKVAPLELHSESTDTTHFSTWDVDGNVVSNTYTLNFSYGNGIAVEGAGFLLNNEMDDFSAKPGVANAYGLLGADANAIEAFKRPLSSMTPTIVFKDGKPVLATGSPGGSTIITIVLQNILNVIEWDMNVAEAVSVPRIHHQWYPDVIRWEEGISIDTRRLMEARGHVFGDKPYVWGKAESIQDVDGVLQGAADPRWPDSGASGVRELIEGN